MKDQKIRKGTHGTSDWLCLLDFPQTPPYSSYSTSISTRSPYLRSFELRASLLTLHQLRHTPPQLSQLLETIYTSLFAAMSNSYLTDDIPSHVDSKTSLLPLSYHHEKRRKNTRWTHRYRSSIKFCTVLLLSSLLITGALIYINEPTTTGSESPIFRLLRRGVGKIKGDIRDIGEGKGKEVFIFDENNNLQHGYIRPNGTFVSVLSW